MYMHFTHTRPWTDIVCNSQGLEFCGIIPVCISSAMCSGQTKEMNLCDLMWGCAPEQGKRITPRTNIISTSVSKHNQSSCTSQESFP